MKRSRFSAQLLAALCMTSVGVGCATRPDIESTTGLNAFHIAQTVRCEIRDAIIEIVADAYKRSGDEPKAERLRRRDFRTKGADTEEAGRFEGLLEHAKRIARKNTEGGRYVDNLDTTIARYADTAIGYEFQLDLKQTNNLGASVDLLATFTRGTVTATPGASVDGTRQATRNFRLVDTFGGLLVNQPTIRVCNQLRRDLHAPRSPNSFYPIAGSLRLERLLREFVSFNQSANLVGPADSQIPTMAEIIDFTTTLKAGIEPELTLSPLDRDLQITGANLTLKTERFDRHKLTLTFSMPAGIGPATAERSQTEDAAIQELERQRYRQLDSDTQDFLQTIVGR